MTFARYVALGDSISIDLYPARDVADSGVHGAAARGLGAASLFYRNNDARWPEFRDRDLTALYPGIGFRNNHELAYPTPGVPTDNHTTDGATTSDVLEIQLPNVTPSAERTLVTLTAAGNDMLMMLHAPSVPRDFAAGILRRVERILKGVAARLPDALTLVGTVYDPSDGTNDLGGGRLDREAGWLRDVNDGIRETVARQGARARLADIHRHFLGHGVTAPVKDRWYWSGLIFEPNARGASEVRRLWLEGIRDG